MTTEDTAPKLAREFIVKKGKDDQFYWHAKASNGRITFQGESHPEPAKAIRAIEQEMKALGSTLPIRITVINGSKKEVRELPAAVSLGNDVESAAPAEPIKPIRGRFATSPATSAMINNALANVVHKPPSGAVAMAPIPGQAKVPPAGEITMRNTVAPVAKQPNLPAAVKSLHKAQPAAKNPSRLKSITAGKGK